MEKNYEDVNVLWDSLLDMALFTYDELMLVTRINGYNVKSLNDCIYVRYGYRDLQQMLEEEEEYFN